jgi:transcriptional regulator with XRE-family HTH domain
MDWIDYVRKVVGNDRQIDVARKTGIDQTTVSRWLAGGTGPQRISSQSVAKFARGYNRPVLEAFVVAGFLTAEEAGTPPPAPLDLENNLDEALDEVGHEALLRALQRRLLG